MKQHKPKEQLHKKSSGKFKKQAKQPQSIASAEVKLRSIRIKEFIWLSVCLFVAIPPFLVSQVAFGLDPSWQLSLSLAVQKHLVFGRDYILTYGPLGILITKYAIVISKWNILLFELIRTGCILYIARLTLKPAGYKTAPSLLFCMIIFLLNSWGGKDFYLTPIFLFCITYFLRYRNFSVLYIAAIVSILSFYIKVNYGFILIPLLYFTLILSAVLKITDYKKAILLITIHALLTAALGFILNVNIPGYIESSLHLINGYAETMYIPIAFSNWYMMMALVVIGLYVTGFLICARYFLKNFVALFCYLFAGLYLFLLFKNGYVRADNHIYSFFNSCPVVFGILYIFLKDTKGKVWGILTCCAVIISYAVFLKKPERFLNMDTTHRWGAQVFNKSYLSDIFKDVTRKNNPPPRKNNKLSIPQSYLNEIGQSSVDILPWEISLIYAHHLNYNPRPVVQTYTAYDEYLDRMNYEKYISSSAPEYLIYSELNIDNRTPFWDESMTKRAILTNYEVIDPDTLFQNTDVSYPKLDKLAKLFNETTYVLLKKRKKPLTMKVVNEKKIQLELGREYLIDSTENIQYLYASPEYNFAGKLRGLFFQPPGLSVILKFQDGGTRKFKAVVPILKTGVLLNRQVLDTYQAAVFFNMKGRKNQKIASIRFVAGSGFKPVMNAVIQERQIVEQ